MISTLNALLVAMFLLNLFVLGASRIRSLIQAAAIQGAVLGFLPFLAYTRLSPLTGLVAIAAILVKAFIIPNILFKAMRDAQINREVQPAIGFVPSILLGALGTAAAIGLAAKLPLAPAHAHSLIVPAALSTVFTGFLLLTSRFKAITQVIGYLVLENGIFIFGLLLIEAMPFLVEIGVLLDLLVAVFVISIIMHHINREFASLDTRELAALKD